MFRIPESALRYEKYRRLLEAEEAAPAEDPNAQAQDPNAAPAEDPNAQAQDPNAAPAEDGMDPNAMQTEPSGLDQAQTPEQAYEAGLKEIQNTIAMTGRKRYARYKVNGGKDSWEVFRKNLEDSLKQELEDDCKEMYGYNPGKTTEKDLLVMIKNGIEQLNQAMTAGMQAEQPVEDPNAQQAMQEAYDFIANRQYNNFMKRKKF
jgi:hypothetical protein